MQIKSFFAATIGTMIEYYDYALYFIFLPILSPLFFPAHSVYESMVKGYLVSGIAMIARPLGGLFFGFIGDMVGRRKALLSSMSGIAIATFAIGMIPSYESIGVYATILVMLAKAVQLFCFGGEYNGAGIYVVEHSEKHRESFFGSLVSAATLFGSLSAALVAFFLTQKFMPAWSWRVAFMLGGILGFIGILYRKNLNESPHFQKANQKEHSLRNLFKNYPRELFAGVMLGGLSTVPFSSIMIFTLPVLMSKGFFSASHTMLVHAMLDGIAIITLLMIGVLADKKTPYFVMQIACGALIIFSYPLFLLIDQLNIFGVIFAGIALIILAECFFGPSNAFLKNLFPMQYRYRGASLSFAFGMGLFGALTPLVESFLYHMTGHFSVLAIWVMTVSFVTSIALYLVARQNQPALFAETRKYHLFYHYLLGHWHQK